MITVLEGIIRTIKVIDGELRHEWYDRTVKLAEDLTAFVTGEGLDAFLKQFVLRESEELFKQRTIHTQHIIPSVAKILMDVSYKVPRSNAMRRVLLFEDQEKAKKFQEILNKFWGTMSWDDYMATRFIEMNYIDPNAFLVFEFAPFDNKTERVQPFPFEVTSKMAVDYWFKNKILQYLLVRTTQNTLTNRENDERYTLYLANQTINFDIVDFMNKEDKENEKQFAERIRQKFGITESLKTTLDGRKKFENITVSQEGFIRIGFQVWKIIIFKPHNLGVVPAMQYGFVPDLFTDRKMFRNPFDAAIPYMMKTIKTVSEMDLSMSLHAMPQKIAYQNSCINCNGTGQDAKGSCPDCKGMGLQLVTSAQDSIIIALPKNATADKIIDISKLIHYDYPPVDGLTFQSEYIDKLERKAKKAVYGDSAVRKDQINKTATESLIEESKTYDALHPLTKMYGRFWEFGIDIIGALTEFTKDITVRSLKFAKDLKFLDKTDYLDMVKQADEGGADPQVKNNLNDEIIKLDFSEEPILMQKYIVQKYFLPFQNLRKDEKLLTLGSRPPTDKEKILYESFTTIFHEIEQEQLGKGVNFYEIGRSKQIIIVDAKLDERVTKIKTEQEANRPQMSFSENG